MTVDGMESIRDPNVMEAIRMNTAERKIIKNVTIKNIIIQ